MDTVVTGRSQRQLAAAARPRSDEVGACRGWRSRSTPNFVSIFVSGSCSPGWSVRHRQFKPTGRWWIDSGLLLAGGDFSEGGFRLLANPTPPRRVPLRSYCGDPDAWMTMLC